MSDMTLLKALAAATAMGLLTFLGVAAERKLRGYHTVALRRAAFLQTAVACISTVLLIAINPARWPDPAVKVIGDLLALAAIATFIAAIALGFALRARR